MRERRILVTGGAGFLGSHLCDRLVEAGHEVVCLDNFYTGTRHNVEHLLGHPRFEIIRHDISEPIIVEVDEVYHLACAASPIHYQRHPVQTIRTCVQGTLNTLNLAREVAARIVIASTSEVYGDPSVHPQPETYWGNVNSVGDRACYDEGKRCAEALAVSYAQQFGVEVRIARIFNTYGPRLHASDGRVVPAFILQALRNQPLMVFGDGQQTRSFCYVDDLIEGLVRLMASDVATPINLGNPHETSILALAEHIVRRTGASSVIVHDSPAPDDPRRRLPDITRAQEVLGWAPAVSLNDGLTKTIQHFRNTLTRIDGDE